MSNVYTPILVERASPVLEILIPSKTAKFPSKNLINWNHLKKFMQIGIDVAYMHTNFGGQSFFGFGDTDTFKNGKISLPAMDYRSSKNLIYRNHLKKFIQIGIDVAYMHNNFGEHDLSGFGDTAAFKDGQFSISNHGL